jgi:RNA polymerase sigma-70 factor (ECF subfamily)
MLATQPSTEEFRMDDARARLLFGEHFDYVWRLLRRLGVAESAVDDAAQQVFLVAVHRMHELGRGAEKAFLSGTALRIASNQRRSQQRRQREVADERPLLEAVDPGGSPEELVEQKRALALLDRALDELPADLREAFVLFELGDLSMPEIAELLHIPRGTVASRLRRAREQFVVCALRLQGGHRG